MYCLISLVNALPADLIICLIEHHELTLQAIRRTQLMQQSALRNSAVVHFKIGQAGISAITTSTSVVPQSYNALFHKNILSWHLAQQHWFSKSERSIRSQDKLKPKYHGQPGKNHGQHALITSNKSGVKACAQLRRMALCVLYNFCNK